MKVIKRDLSVVVFDEKRIENAIKKAGGDDLVSKEIANRIHLKGKDFSVSEIEKLAVDYLIEFGFKDIAISYEDYRCVQEYKKSVLRRSETNRILTETTRENANKNSQLVSTKKGLTLDAYITDEMLNHDIPRKLSDAHKKNEIKFHDVADRKFGGINCCLFDMKTVIDNSPTINGLKYDKAESVEAYLGVLSDVLLEASSQQYGRR